MFIADCILSIKFKVVLSNLLMFMSPNSKHLLPISKYFLMDLKKPLIADLLELGFIDKTPTFIAS